MLNLFIVLSFVLFCHILFDKINTEQSRTTTRRWRRRQSIGKETNQIDTCVPRTYATALRFLSDKQILKNQKESQHSPKCISNRCPGKPAITRWNQLINEACKTPKKECQQPTEWVLGWNRTYTQWNNGIRRLPVSNLWFRFASLSHTVSCWLRNTRNQPHGAICKPGPGPNKKDTTEMCQCDISTANKCHSLHFVDCMRTA